VAKHLDNQREDRDVKRSARKRAHGYLTLGVSAIPGKTGAEGTLARQRDRSRTAGPGTEDNGS